MFYYILFTNKLSQNLPLILKIKKCTGYVIIITEQPILEIYTQIIVTDNSEHINIVNNSTFENPKKVNYT